MDTIEKATEILLIEPFLLFVDIIFAKTPMPCISTDKRTNTIQKDNFLNLPKSNIYCLAFRLE
jgi:hypothetical protein